MYDICVCKGCGRTLEKRFVYCPWCGVSRMGEKGESLDVLLNHYEENRREIRRKQLYEMEKELNDLEEELSVLVLSSQMHK